MFKEFFAKYFVKITSGSNFIGVVSSDRYELISQLTEHVLKSKFTVIKSVLNSTENTITKTILENNKSNKKIIYQMMLEENESAKIYTEFATPEIILIDDLSGFSYSNKLEVVKNELKYLIENLPNTLFIVNWDDINSRTIFKDFDSNMVFYGYDPNTCHVYFTNAHFEGYQTVFEINYGVERAEIRSNLLGKSNIYPQMLAASIAFNSLLGITSVKRALENFNSPKSSMSLLMGYNGSLIIDDTAAVSIKSLFDVIDTMDSLESKRRILVIGRMSEADFYSAKHSQDIARKIFKSGVNKVLIVSAEGNLIAEELIKLGFLVENIASSLTNQQVVSKLLKIVSRGDVLLIKGAKQFRPDEIIDKLTKR